MTTDWLERKKKIPLLPIEKLNAIAKERAELLEKHPHQSFLFCMNCGTDENTDWLDGGQDKVDMVCWECRTTGGTSWAIGESFEIHGSDGWDDGCKCDLCGGPHDESCECYACINDGSYQKFKDKMEAEFAAEIKENERKIAVQLARPHTEEYQQAAIHDIDLKVDTYHHGMRSEQQEYEKDLGPHDNYEPIFWQTFLTEMELVRYKLKLMKKEYHKHYPLIDGDPLDASVSPGPHPDNFNTDEKMKYHPYEE